MYLFAFTLVGLVDEGVAALALIAMIVKAIAAAWRRLGEGSS
jgi:hypothetical protein